MVRLDLTIFKYLTIEDFRVLLAIELGMRNHEYVPVNLIESVAKLKKSNITKVISNLLKNKLIEHNNQTYDGYALNYLGYDFLAIRALLKKGLLVKILSRMGVGKESDVFYCLINSVGISKELNDEEIADMQVKLFENDENDENFDLTSLEIEEKDEENKEKDEESQSIDYEEVEKQEKKEIQFENYNQLQDMYSNMKENGSLILGILKLARLGRTSFRAVKSKRDFVKNKTHYNWIYLSRLSSQTESKFLNGLYMTGFPVPKPFGNNRHAILMEYIPGYQLSKVTEIKNPEKVYNNLISILYKFAESGLVHGDYNEFNILITDDERIKVIDFTQMISRDHDKASDYFKRDVNGIKHFFMKRFHLEVKNEEEEDVLLSNIKRNEYLDVQLNAFGIRKNLDENLNFEVIENENDNDVFVDVEAKIDVEVLDLLNVKENHKEESIRFNIKDSNNSITKKEIIKKVVKQIQKENKCKTKYKGNSKSSQKTIKKGVDY